MRLEAGWVCLWLKVICSWFGTGTPCTILQYPARGEAPLHPVGPCCIFWAAQVSLEAGWLLWSHSWEMWIPVLLVEEGTECQSLACGLGPERKQHYYYLRGWFVQPLMTALSMCLHSLITWWAVLTAVNSCAFLAFFLNSKAHRMNLVFPFFEKLRNIYLCNGKGSIALIKVFFTDCIIRFDILLSQGLQLIFSLLRRNLD